MANYADPDQPASLEANGLQRQGIYIYLGSAGQGLTLCMLGKNFSRQHFGILLRKHTYSNILKILPPKNENSGIFHISAQKQIVGTH